MSFPTVADSLLFDSLPIETRRAVHRLYGGCVTQDVLQRTAESSYRAGYGVGFDDGCKATRATLAKERAATTALPPNAVTNPERL